MIGRDAPAERPFIVSPRRRTRSSTRTYPLPEAQLDRFLLRIGVGYPSREHGIEMLARRIERGDDEIELSPVVDTSTLVSMQRALEHVHVAAAIEGYIVDLVAATRASKRLAVGASPAGPLLKLSREGGARGPRLLSPKT